MLFELAKLAPPTYKAGASPAQVVKTWPPAKRRKWWSSLTEQERIALAWDWRFIGRPEQQPPPWGWYAWLLCCGRGWGKTRCAVSWVQQRANEGGVGGRIALAGRTAKDMRETMIEGESGLLACGPPHNRPVYKPGLGRVVWPSGVVGICYSADAPDTFRGPQHHYGWADELAAWRYGRECWQQMGFGMRLGKRPQVVISTTPRPIRIIRELAAKHGKNIHVTYGSTYDNLHNLSDTFKETVLDEYEGTSIGMQELYGRILDDNPGALWRRAMFDAEGFRVEKPPHLTQCVVAVDPSVTSGEESALAGIVTCGRGADDLFYGLADNSMRAPPFRWASEVVEAYRRHKADCVVYEENQGGDLIPTLIKSIDSTIPCRGVRATRNKQTRAEPVAALYEQGRVRHVGFMEDLEDELCNFDPGNTKQPSPDRMDALVWGMSFLLQRKKQALSPSILSLSPLRNRDRY